MADGGSDEGDCESVLSSDVLRRVQLRVAGALLSEVPRYESTFGAQAAEAEDKDGLVAAHCPVDTLPRQPAVLGGAATDAAAQDSWYASHAYCLMCNAHAPSACSQAYYLYNAHRGILDSMVRRGSRSLELQARGGGLGDLMLAVGSQATIQLWLSMYLSMAVATCHGEHAHEIFNEASLAAAEEGRLLLAGARTAAAVLGGEGLPSAPLPSDPRPPPDVAPDGYFAAAVRRAHRDLLVDMSVIEAATAAVSKAADSAAAAAEAGEPEAEVARLQGAAEGLPDFLKTSQLGTCAALVDIAAALRDAIAVRRAVVDGQGAGVLGELYGRHLAQQLGKEAFSQPPPADEHVRAPDVLPGTPAPSCGVYIDAQGQLHMPPPCFVCPASHEALLQDIWGSLEQLGAGER